MIIPGLICLVVFAILPMFGVMMAFQRFVPAKGIFGSEFVGLRNFQRIIKMMDFRQVITNTLILSALKMAFGLLAPVTFAIVLNECRSRIFKRTVQTVVYLPHFLSWVVLSVVFVNFFSLSGMFNNIVAALGGERQVWLIRSGAFRQILVVTDVWKGFGYGAIVYLAAITSISPELYESASLDGASRMQRIWHLTLPGILPTVVLMATLSLQNILNAGFDQVYNLYSPLVYSTGDIIDTYIYRTGLVNMQYSLSAAVGLFKSLIGFIMIALSYVLAKRLAGYAIF
jgi:putative aldouronate transport system permease protein